MNVWRRTVGVDLVETILVGAGSFIMTLLAVELSHDRLVGMGVALTCLAAFGIRRHFAIRALGGEVETSGGYRLADVEGRLAELEALHARVAELEERVDFAERLLAQKDVLAKLEGPR